MDPSQCQCHLASELALTCQAAKLNFRTWIFTRESRAEAHVGNSAHIDPNLGFPFLGS